MNQRLIDKLLDILIGIFIFLTLLFAGMEGYEYLQIQSRKETINDYLYIQGVESSKETFSSLEPEVPSQKELNDSKIYPKEKESKEDYKEVIPVVSKDFFEEYPKAVAWLYEPALEINYPIMQAQDNDYYLTHSYDDTGNRYGSLFLDSRCRMEDDVLLIHGHNARIRTMFGGLRSYVDSSYVAAHPTMWFGIKNPSASCADVALEEYQIKMVSIVCDTARIYSVLDEAAISELKENAFSFFEIDSKEPEVPHDAQIILLSTCYGVSGTDKRLVIAIQRTIK